MTDRLHCWYILGQTGFDCRLLDIGVTPGPPFRLMNIPARRPNLRHACETGKTTFGIASAFLVLNLDYGPLIRNTQSQALLEEERCPNRPTTTHERSF